MVVSGDSPRPKGRPASILTWAADRIGSIWFGVGLLAAIFLYSSVGSAVPPIRQGALADWAGLEFLRFEKSEPEWFSWWPFLLMIALLCLSLVLATLRRIPLTVLNAGVWTTHLGMIILAISAAVYFGQKVEGDVVIFQWRALILAPGMTEPASMLVRPQASIDLAAAGKRYHIRVARIDPNYEIPTGEHKGVRTTSIWLNVESSEPPGDFIRALLVGYRRYTQDVIRGPQGLQPVSTLPGGRRLIDNQLQIELDYDEPARYYYHAQQPPAQNTGAIYARFSPADEWTQFRFRGLPHYRERVSSPDDVWPVREGALEPIGPLNLQARALAPAAGFEGIQLRVTGYLPYAQLEQRWVAAGSTSQPARLEVRPAIVPRRRRQPLQKVGKIMSLIQVRVEDAGGTHRLWLPFNQYVFKNRQRAYPSRFAYEPGQVQLSDGRVLQLMYSRWRDPLSAPMVLDRFILETYPGGDRESDYISLVRFQERDGWSDLVEVKSNQPARHGDLWYFQAQWDPGAQAYTVLGVGNREAVGPMLFGVCVSIAGMIYAFYIKPTILRRRRSAAATEALGSRKTEGSPAANERRGASHG